MLIPDELIESQCHNLSSVVEKLKTPELVPEVNEVYKTWDELHSDVAKAISKKSKDTSNKFGCVFVDPKTNIQLILGFNGIPRGVCDSDPRRDERPEKYYWYEHAERNAIYNAARKGISLDGSVLYIGQVPCHKCARGILQVGCKQVILIDNFNYDYLKRYGESVLRSLIMFREVGIIVRKVNSDVNICESMLRIVCELLGISYNNLTSIQDFQNTSIQQFMVNFTPEKNS